MLIGAEFHCLDLPINVLSPKGSNREAQGNALGRRYEGVFQAEGLRQGAIMTATGQRPQAVPEVVIVVQPEWTRKESASRPISDFPHGVSTASPPARLARAGISGAAE
jgi:hypothetical protein